MESSSLDQVRQQVIASSAEAVVAASGQRAREVAELGVFLSLAEHPQPGEGLLAGVPLAVKDNLDTRDLPTTGGTPALRDSRPGRDHHALARLREAGAAVIGKTNLHELALGITSNNAAFGPVRNPHDPTRSAGGSSGGSAVAVATGVVPIALGTDTGGSLRVPAAHCGVVGWRPTTGRWGTGRTVPISRTRDTAGVLATSVADAALVDEVVTGEPAAAASGRPLRLGVPREGFYDDLHPEVARCTEEALDRLAAAGVELVEVQVVGGHTLDAECGFPIVFFEIAQDLPAYLATLPGPESGLTLADVLAQVASPDVRGALEAVLSGVVTEEVYREAMATRDRLRAAYAAALQPAGVQRLDALVYPTVPLPPPPLGDDDTTELNGHQVPVFLTTIRNTGPGSTAGMPAISLPAGTTRAGLPIGISLEALPGEDAALLASARLVEAALDRGRATVS
ncbi:amidase family protein [Modestobacter sp. VKM Ac-2979]|uniref:amidase family protein n=1 Tax=unclassified Modestobacter TaxID=2643866 RepID=UPI0022ABC2BD|nr:MULTISPECIES: amidase family protein [unclassified Modestobacter]MCZ2814002.1 amidase family protein [Modestobacter sp. VKM Ac-2979]MCZ2844582.1 amidase family protein [Modestobacter sp. VKM Ac-2980]